jgi:EPS-associated MarR family transcriptional regulator
VAKRTSQEDAYFRILRIIDANPDYTQRQISEALGVSLGAVNYCLRAMIDVGFVKAKNFRSSNNKLRYAYILTPHGAAEKLFLTGVFLQRKMKEFEALRVEIDALQSEVGEEVCRTYLHGQ